MAQSRDTLRHRIEELTAQFISPEARRFAFVCFVLGEKPCDALNTTAGLGARHETIEEFVDIALEMGVTG